MRNLFLIILITLGSVLVNAQNLVLPLYGKAEFEKIASLDDEMPELHVYLTDKPSSQAVVVCPGGGYKGLSFGSEGVSVAKWLNQNGIAAFVVKYRMPAGRQEVPVEDLTRAFEIVMANADKWNLDSCRIGLMGFSAGGHLCASLSVHWKDIKDPDPVYDRVSNRPDAAILAYPVITAGKAAHPGSFVALFGENPDQKDLDYMSLEKHVTADTPPCFLWQTATDESVPVENSYLFAKACKEAGVPYAHHVFSDGVHGMSVATEDWLEERGREPYTMEQIRLLGEAILRGETRFEKKTGEELLAKYGISRPAPEKWSRDEKEHLRKVLKEVGAWRMLAKCWLAAVWDV